MIDDMALLKRTMQQMDAEDPTVAQAAKDRAAQILDDARLNFSKMADLIEKRRLLLPPAILGRIKKMDQPGMLGDGAFQDTGTALRREGLSFLQIAEAIEASESLAPASMPAPRYDAPVQDSEPFYAIGDEPRTPAWLRALFFVGRIVLFPVRHPLRSLTIALFALVLLYAARAVIAFSGWAYGYSQSAAIHRVDTAISSVNSFVHERILRQGKETSPQPDAPSPSPTLATAAPPPSAAPSAPPLVSPSSPTPSAAPAAVPAPSVAPSAAPATTSASPSSAPAPTANQSASLAPPSAYPLPPSAYPAPSRIAPAAPPGPPPRRDARDVPPSRSAANRPRAFDDPTGFARNSRFAGPCRGGVGGCYWGGPQF
jgi:hypothetical protein